MDINNLKNKLENYEQIKQELHNELLTSCDIFYKSFLEIIYTPHILKEFEELQKILKKYQFEQNIVELPIRTRILLKLSPSIIGLNKLFDFYNQTNQSKIYYHSYNYKNGTLEHLEDNVMKNPFFQEVFSQKMNNQDLQIAIYNHSERLIFNGNSLFGLNINQEVLLKIKLDYLSYKKEDIKKLEKDFYDSQMKNNKNINKLKI